MKKAEISLRDNLLWSSVGSLLYLASQWAILLLVARVIGYIDAGYLSLAISITNILYGIASYGIRNFQVFDVNSEFKASTYVISRFLTVAVSILMCVIFVALNKYNTRISIIIITYMIFKSIEAIIDVYHGIDQKEFRMDIIGKSFALRGLAAFTIFLVLIIKYKNMEYGIIAMTISSAIIMILYDIPYSKILSSELTHLRVTRLVIDDTIRLLKKCSPLVMYLFLAASIGSIPRYILEKMTNSEQLGIYASIAAPAALMQVASSYIFNPFIVAFSNLYAVGNSKEFKKLFIKITGYVTLLSMGFFIVAILFGDIGLKILIGSSILPYSYLLIPILICTVLTAYIWFINAILIVLREFKKLIITNIITVVNCTVLSIYFIKNYEMQGVNISTIVSLTIQIIILVILPYKKLRST